jgi:hypothetical protein
MSKWYAVARGRETGVFTSWDEARPLVDGYPNNRYKSFLRRDLALAWFEAQRMDQQEQDRAMSPGNTRPAIDYESLPTTETNSSDGERPHPDDELQLSERKRETPEDVIINQLEEDASGFEAALVLATDEATDASRLCKREKVNPPATVGVAVAPATPAHEGDKADLGHGAFFVDGVQGLRNERPLQESAPLNDEQTRILQLVMKGYSVCIVGQVGLSLCVHCVLSCFVYCPPHPVLYALCN